MLVGVLLHLSAGDVPTSRALQTLSYRFLQFFDPGIVWTV